MIQRVQSLLLLGVIVCMTLLLIFPIWEAEFSLGIIKGFGELTGTGVEMDAFYLEVVSKKGIPVTGESGSVFYIAIIAVLIIATASYEIFQFRDRKKQIKIGAVNNLLLILLIGAIFLGIYTAEGKYDLENDTYLTGFFMPLIAIILNIFATKQIRKDEKLVRSADRLR